MSRIAVVDDEPGIVWALSEFFRGEGHDVVTAATAEDGLRLMRAAPPDVAFIDIRLPGMDGLTAAEQLRRDLPLVRVVVITAHGTIDHAVRAMKAGAVEYLTKPLDLAKAREAAGRSAAMQRKGSERCWNTWGVEVSMRLRCIQLTAEDPPRRELKWNRQPMSCYGGLRGG